jgi:hypothetical protein
MIDRIKIAFTESLNNCITVIENKHTYIFEDNKGVIVSAKETHHLHIENQSNKSYFFIQNDDCIMKNIKDGQCDYVICNPKSIYFVEVKVAKNNLANHRKEAYKQLVNTYKYYSKHIKFTEEDDLIALVCFPSKRRIVNPSGSTKRKEFLDNYKINLQIGNYILME